MANNKKVRMPAGIRNKLMAALCMLLVSTIMLVSATYAWFTLSTAPEVTGITTSVGANGNLEIALLTTDTYTTPASITSAVGDSSAADGQTVPEANITWGNLVDLSDASYGLSTLSLNQAIANIDSETGNLVTNAPLKTAVYGADGRVASVGGTIVSAVKDATTGAFTYTSGSQTYGVRAVGQANNITPRQMAYNGAKTAVTSNQSNAVKGAKNAIAGAGTTFYALALAGTTPTSYSYAQVEAMKDIAAGIKSSLNSVVLVYANSGLVAAASGSTATDEQIETLQAAITSDAAAMKLALNTAGVSTFDSQLTALATAQSDVNTAITSLNALLTANTAKDAFDSTTNFSGSGDDVTYINDLLTGLVGSGSSAYDAYDETDTPITGGVSAILEANGPKVYMKAGALGTLASYTGAFQIAEMMGINVYAGQITDTASYPDISGYAAPAGSTSASNITDSYGFILDFAFRTNAADSVLQLQTDAVNRVYSDANDANLATMGAGSTIEFTYGASTSVEQAENLLSNIKIIFFDPASGAIFANGAITSVSAASGSATGEITLVKAVGTEADALDDIVALNQNEIKFVSVLVYLDGENITNADVANAASSGTLDMNLQFSSSTELVPMENSALRNMTAA